jgi:uncharacterized protein involved in outer membrane biogenesis
MLRALLAILALHRVALGIAAALIIVYALAGFFWVPHLLRTNAQKYVSDELGRGLELGEVAFNPFTFRLGLRNVTLSEKSGEPIASFESLVVNAELASIWQRAVVLKEVQLDAPDVNLVLERDGSINLSHLAPPKAAEPANEPAAPLPRIRIGRLAVNGGRVDFLDRTRPEPFTATLAPIRFALTDFRTDLNHENAYDFAAQSSAGETLNWSGRFTAQPVGSDGQFRIGQLRAQTIDDYLQGQLPVRLADGKLSFAGTYKLALQPTLALDIGLPEIALDDFALAERAAADSPPLAVIPKVRVLGTQFALANRSLRVDKVEVVDAQVRAAREADGSLSVQRLTKSSPQPAPAEPEAAATEPAPASAPWKWAVGEIRVANATADLEDHAVSPTVQLHLTPVALTVAGLSSEQGAKVNVSADLGLNGASVFKTSGDVQLAPLTAALALDLNALDLSILQPYVAQATNLTLRSGRLSVKGDVSAAMEEGASPRLEFRGDVQVADLHTIAGPANDDLVKWRNLAVTGIDVSRNPDRLTIDRVVARQPYARVIIAQDRALNVTQALKRESGESTESAEQTAPPAAEPAKSPPMPVRIKSVSITGGSAMFADNSITPSFATGIVDLEGTVTGLSSQADSRAKVKLAGKVDRYAPVDITGEVNLLAAAKYSDVALNFRNMELTTFNPYSGKFAGYNISKGKLSTELRYKVQNRMLDAQHHIVVDNLEFGDKTDSKDAAPIPIKLAVALLKDRQGVIDLQLPVGGSLDDPKFRLGPIIWKALLGLLTKIVTSPFAALGSLFGGGEELAYVDFPAGSADLPANKIEQLGKLSQALVERPQLRLDVPVTLIAEQDSKAIAAASLYARVPKLPDGSDEAALKKRLTQLEALYKEKAKIAPDYPAETKTESGVDVNARTEWIEAHLLENMQPDAAALEALSRQRAQAVQAAILANTDVPPERVFITTDRSAALTNDGAVRMEMKLE